MLLLPWATLQHHGDRTHQVCDSAHSDSSCKQLPHMNKRLFSRAATSPARLCSRKETATGHLKEAAVLTGQYAQN